VIVGGHSIWFRSFSNVPAVQCPSRIQEQKIVNGGIVTSDIMKAETRQGPSYMIDPQDYSVYRGFKIKALLGRNRHSL
jgi:hypothetical protein